VKTSMESRSGRAGAKSVRGPGARPITPPTARSSMRRTGSGSPGILRRWPGTKQSRPTGSLTSSTIRSWNHPVRSAARSSIWLSTTAISTARLADDYAVPATRAWDSSATTPPVSALRSVTSGDSKPDIFEATYDRVTS